ncbi:hypothetical protein M433DRAFT_543222 [Acidomyces richmondensis BFW]|nr:MAG: hypothetical protein FE78DRAFT_154437 [Acidomyces sp. 'richmondensis']KYG43420.1 hypothetical protein M433DRAFT_543222 [Acidomyces richmondensis BFW]
MYTASFAFFEALWEAGVTHCFVNLGSDHPSILEAMVKGQRETPDAFPRIITCPNEMVALSMADGYARVTNRPQAVIVHVDVGTQGLGAAVHNASCGRAPVLIFAGLSPYTIEGEYRGSRTEYIHWIQDVPDQKAIVGQYCRYTAEIKRGRNVKQLVHRALSFATSEPRGPVYLVGAREAMEEEIEPYHLDPTHWGPAELGGLTTAQLKPIAEALVAAQEPLVITGYSGRNHAAVAALVRLADTVKGLRVLDTGGSDMCFPASHPAWLGLRFGVDDAIRSADVILLVDVDVPWIPTQCRPRSDAEIFHLDCDPLKQQMPVFYVPARARYRVNSAIAVNEIAEYITTHFASQISAPMFVDRWAALQKAHADRLASIAALAQPSPDGTFGCAYLLHAVRAAVPADTIWAVEAVTNTFAVADQVQAHLPGSWINCGGGGLGWSGGGALGVKLATDYAAGGTGKGKFVCQVVGDGTFLFSVPGSVYWIAQRYGIPVLVIVLNNQGWNAPRKSMLLVHPDGEGSKVDNKALNISFAPTPDYAGIARAASGGKAWAGRAGTAAELAELLPKAVEAVKGGVCAVLDAHLGGPEGKFQG